MAKTLVVVIKLKDDADSYAVTDAFNDVLRSSEVYQLIDDADDLGWEYLESKEV